MASRLHLHFPEVDSGPPWRGSGSSGCSKARAFSVGEPDDSDSPERKRPGRENCVFGLATTFDSNQAEHPDALRRWIETHPEHRDWIDENGTQLDLAFVPTVFNKLDANLCRKLVYRGWWLAGAALSANRPDLIDPSRIEPPPISSN